MNSPEGEIKGRPTLMAIFPEKLARDAVLAGLRAGGYTSDDVMVYYRLKGTDQVVNAETGRIAPGQALDEAQLTPAAVAGADTIVLAHPSEGEVEIARAALMALGNAHVLYEGETIVAGQTTGEAAQAEQVTDNV